jgi:hypothetical protein
MRANKVHSSTGRIASLARLPLALAVIATAVLLATAADAAGFGRGGGGGHHSIGNGGNRGPASIINPGGKKLDWKKPSIGSSSGGRGAVTGDGNRGGRDRPHRPRSPKWPVIPVIVGTPPLIGAVTTPVLGTAKPAALSVANPGGSGPSGRQARRSTSGMPPAGERRYVPDEVVIQLSSSLAAQTIDALALRHRLNRIETLTLATGSTLFRWKIQDRRSVPEVIRSLEADRLVENVQPNYVHTTQEQQSQEQPGASGEPPPSEQAAPEGPRQYAPDRLRLPQAHALAKGDKVLIAVIDSSIDTAHPELAGMVVKSYDALGTAEKPHSHGTAIAGAIVAHSKLTGAAPQARILGVTAFGATATSAEGTTFAIVKGIDWAAAQGARIINMSFAGPRDPALGRKLAQARQQGIILVAAAGNAGPKSPPLYPAADPNVIAVTATDIDDKLYQSANRGKHIAVAAPGVDLLLPAPAAGYQMTSGTSFAAAEVSGIVALLLERKRDLGQDRVRQMLAASAQDLGPKGFDPQYGAGLVDAYRAILSLVPAAGETMGRTTPAAARQ